LDDDLSDHYEHGHYRDGDDSDANLARRKKVGYSSLLNLEATE
jgi:hypothetical protein